ncbi:MAG TPA: chorismate mutase [Magnetospirillaceae bacterium]|nr:chorismate mutase [Magnetospirillaceae bacterium]
MTSKATIPPELLELRDSIDNIDAALIHVIAERFKYTRRVGQLKARLDLPAGDPAREEQQIARLRSLANSAKLDPVFAEKLFKFIVEEVIRNHLSIKESE